MGVPEYNAGDEVFVFYRVSKSCEPKRKYLCCIDQRHGTWRPRHGVSDGWVPARVVSTAGQRVKVEYTWDWFFTARGQMADQTTPYYEWYSDKHCRPAAADLARKFPVTDHQPDLALITFRWGGKNEITPPRQWGSTGSSVSDLFINSFLDRSVIPALGTSVEVWTVYIEDHSDMNRVANAANLIFGANHPARRAKHVGAMYHLYPTAFEENCIPTRETGEDDGAALVPQRSFFGMQQAVERAGIPTRFPHPSNLYELLAAKRWTQLLALAPQFRIPPTIGVPRQLLELSCKEAATKALASLNAVKKRQALLNGCAEDSVEPITRGVAKLGFSWEALDVKHWRQEQGLKVALHQLSQLIEISGELTGQPQDNDTVMVQEFCEHDLECRFYVVDGKVEQKIYTKFCEIRENQEFGDFHELHKQKEAADTWMGGDLDALKDGEQKCLEITEHWLVWLQGQICEVPPAVRFDYFIGRSNAKGKATVWTLEICELGFSMLSAEELPEKVFGAMLKSCLGGSLPAARAVVAEKVDVAVPKVDDVEEFAAATAQPTQSASGKGQGRQHQEVVLPEGTPEHMYIELPFGGKRYTDDQTACTGKYEVLRTLDRLPGGMPVWAHERGDRYLFLGTDENWYVGDDEEYEASFVADSGYIRHVADITNSSGRFPDSCGGPWEYGPDWHADAAIVVSATPITAEVRTKALRIACAAKAKGRARR